MLPDNTVIQLTIGDLRKLVKEIQAPAKRWLSMSEFKRLESKTEDQIKYMRKQHPGLFKMNGSRWVIDSKEYFKKAS